MLLQAFNFSHIILQVKVRRDELKVDFVWSWEESGAKGWEVKSWARGPDVVSTRVDLLFFYFFLANKTRVDLEPPALPLLAALVEEVAAPGVDPDVVRGETGRRDVEVGNVGAQVLPVEDPL